MAFKLTAQRAIEMNHTGRISLLRRSMCGLALPAPLSTAIDLPVAPPLTLPEAGLSDDRSIEFQLPSSVFCGSMELMAVPKKKVSPHKRGIRNGPKALKPTPVIIRCKSCGRVKLPHFYCCGGRREETGERRDSSN
ncbi:hypothetical protein Ancab_018776 [Ancistrocladus abbreviatus]